MLGAFVRALKRPIFVPNEGDHKIEAPIEPTSAWPMTIHWIRHVGIRCQLAHGRATGEGALDRQGSPRGASALACHPKHCPEEEPPPTPFNPAGCGSRLHRLAHRRLGCPAGPSAGMASKIARSRPASCSAIGTPSSLLASTRSSGARVWRSSGCPVGRLGRPPSPKGWEQPGASSSIVLLVFRRRHLEYVLRESSSHYEEARPHQGLGRRTPRQREPTAASETGSVLRRDRLGGVLHEYFQEAA